MAIVAAHFIATTCRSEEQQWPQQQRQGNESTRTRAEPTGVEDAYATLQLGRPAAAAALKATFTTGTVSTKPPLHDATRLDMADGRRAHKAPGISTSRPSQQHSTPLLLLLLLFLTFAGATSSEHNQLITKRGAKAKCKKWSRAQERTSDDANHAKDGEADVHYPCTAGFSHYQGSCYLIIPPSKTILRDRSKARSECASSGGHLVAIESRGEQRYLQNVLNYYYHHSTVKHGAYWTGAHVDERGRWRWDTGIGRKTRAMRFNDWAGDESSWAYELAAGPQGLAHCALLDSADDHRWMFWPCDRSEFPADSARSIGSPIGAICEKPTMNSRTPPCSSSRGSRSGSTTGRSSLHHLR